MLTRAVGFPTPKQMNIRVAKRVHPNMESSLQSLLKNYPTWFFIICFCLWSGTVASGQEAGQLGGPKQELLTMNGSKPNLSATGEGITSYKFDDLYNRGKTSVHLVDPAKLPFKVELPFGYTIFYNLVYGLETDAVFTGPTDITFKLPSARTKETFSQLRILFPEVDYANPGVPKWIDITLDEDISERNAQYLAEAEVKQRLRNFETRTLHAFTVDNPLILLVAVRDPAKRRDKSTADLLLTGTAPEQVTEGRWISYELKLTNKGPDAATGITVHASPAHQITSVKPSAGKCLAASGNIYCTFASLEKDHSIEIKIVERCPWYTADSPVPDGATGTVGKIVEVGATERDPFAENNQLILETRVYRDPNKGPVIEVVSPAQFSTFPGPAATVPIRIKASDPDGFVKKVELFDDEKLIGEAVVQANGEYELSYKEAAFGTHRVTVVATDNLGRFESQRGPDFFVNGTAKVEIINPKSGSKLNKSDGDVEVTIHAAATNSPLKKVSLEIWNSDATPVGNDQYVVKVKNCARKCRLQAIAIDEHGVETRSEPVEFTIVEPPQPGVSWFDGEYARNFEPGQTYKVTQLILMYWAVYEPMSEGEVTKLEVLANGVAVCTDNSPVFGSAEKCVWTPAPGKYKLQVVATDADGAVGKSNPIEITIERP